MSLLDQAKEILAPLAEKALAKAVNEKYDAAFDKLQEDLKEKIKPEELEAILLAVTEVIQPKLKELLLSGIDKIDGKVG